MKKAIVLLGLASAMSAFTGCSKDEPVSPETVGVQEYTINSIIAGGDTRTALDTETLKLSWLKGDKIRVYTGDNALFTEYTTENGDGMFKGSVKPALSSALSYVAVYPDGKFGTVVYNGDPIEALRITVPKDQKYEAGKGPVGAIPMVGIWGDDDESVLFKPVGSALRLPVYSAVEGTNLTSVSFQFQSSSAGNVGAGEIALRNWELDEYGDYKAPDLYYKRTDFAYGEVTSQVTVTGDIALGTTTETAADVYVAVTPGNYQGGYTVTLTDAEGASMSKTKPASASIVALGAGQIQKIAPLQYVQKAPKFTVAENPSDNTVVTATLDAGQTLEQGTTYKYWLESYAYGKWSAASNQTTIPSGDYASFSSVKISDIGLTAWDMPKDGDTMHFVIEATTADGSVYKRVYDYTYHTNTAGEVEISTITWVPDSNSVQIEFTSGIETIKAAAAADVVFSLEGGEMPFATERTLEELTAAGADWGTEWFGEYFGCPLTAFDLTAPIKTGNYTLKITIYNGFSEVASSSATFEVY